MNNYMRMANVILELEDLQDENSKLRALISNNFGRKKNDPAKDRKALATYVELKGYKHGEIGNGRKKTCQNGTSTLDEIAKELNMSKRNLQRVLRDWQREEFKGIFGGIFVLQELNVDVRYGMIMS